LSKPRLLLATVKYARYVPGVNVVIFDLIYFSCLVHEQKEVDQLLTQQTTIKLQTQRYAQKIDAARAECAKLQQEENRQQTLVDVSAYLVQIRIS